MKLVKSLVLVAFFVCSLVMNHVELHAIEYQTIIDLIAIANKATWKSSFGEVVFPTKQGSRTGSVLWLSNTAMENNTQYPLLLQTSPDIQENGYMMGVFSNITIPERARLNTEFGFLPGAESTKGITFSVTFQTGNIRATPLFLKNKTYSRQTEKITVDLTEHALKTGTLTIKVYATSPSLIDLSAWSKVVIEVEKQEKVLPDLIVSNIEISKKQVSYTLKNIGQAATNDLQRGNPLRTDLLLNGTLVAFEVFARTIQPQEEITRTFSDYALPESRKEQIIMICADSTDVVKESEEKNNCLRKVFYPGEDSEKPDLIITNIFSEYGTVAYQLKNIGRGSTGELPANKYFLTSLTLNRRQVALDFVHQIIRPGEEITRTFADFTLPEINDSMVLVVCADSDRAFNEVNEENNCLEKVIPPQEVKKDPLQFLQKPVVISTTPRTVRIQFKTNLDSQALIYYDDHFDTFTQKSTQTKLVKDHDVTLFELKPGTLYRFFVQCIDSERNIIQSEKVLFKTETNPLPKKPTLRFSLGKELSGKVLIQPELSDVNSFSRLLLSIDGRTVFTNYAKPFAFEINTLLYSNGKHEFQVHGVDRNGARIVEKHEALIANQDQTLNLSPEVTIVEPPENKEISYQETSVKVRWLADHQQKRDIIKVEILINGVLYSTETDPDKGFWETGKNLPKGDDVSPSTDYFVEGKNRITIKATDSKNNVGSSEVVIFVRKPKTTPPLLNVSFTVATTQAKTGFHVDLSLTNLGSVKAKSILLKIPQRLAPGFLISNIDQAGDFQITDSYMQVMTFHIQELDSTPGQNTWHVTFDLTPILTQQTEVEKYVIMHTVSYVYDWEDNPNKPVWVMQNISSPVPLDTLYKLINADYLIVTNLNALFQPCQDLKNPKRKSVYQLLEQMGQLAILKQGVIGLFTDPIVSSEQVKNKIATWGWYLSDEFRSNGYLLLVGETEIIPSYSFIVSKKNYSLTVPSSDFPYADTSGYEVVPELNIGRIIGDDAEHLVKPIQASVDIEKGKAYFYRNHHPISLVYCLSGTGEGEGLFWQSAYDIGEMLKQEYQTVVQDRGEAFIAKGISLWQRIQENAKQRISILYWRDHGRADGWGDYGTVVDSNSESPAFAGNLNFGDTRPFIFAACCDAGQYEGMYGIAECLLEKAGAYISSTSLSDRKANNEFAGIFFNHWINQPGVSLGKAFKETRIIAYKNLFWSVEYQYYGDPKFGR